MKSAANTADSGHDLMLKSLLGFSPTIIYRAVPSGDFRIDFISTNITDILGFLPEDVYADGNFWYDHIYPEDRPTVTHNLFQLFKTDRLKVDYRFHHKDGHYLWLHDQMHVVRGDDGTALEVVGSLTDISQQKQSESQLQSREAYLQTIFRSAQEGIITTNASGAIVSVNPAAERMFGYDDRELLGCQLRSLMLEDVAVKHDESIKRFMHSDMRRAAGQGARELTGRRKEGSEFPIEIAVDHILHNDEDHFLSIVRDIAERKNNEEKILRYSSKMEQLVKQRTSELEVARDEALAAAKTMSRFLSNMSHELRTPLHGILSFAGFGLKKHQKATREKLAQYFGEIQESGNHLLELVNDLLDLSKLRAGKVVYEFQSEGLDTTILKVIYEMRLLAEEKQIEIDWDCRVTSDKIMMDSTKIAQVVRNLLSNAIKFSPEKSVVKVVAERNQDGNVRIEVRDQGFGIPEGEFETIFDAFSQSSATQTNAGGTGLGLPICKEIIEEGHGGRISACNGLDRGAVFTVTLPRTVEKASPTRELA